MVTAGVSLIRNKTTSSQKFREMISNPSLKISNLSLKIFPALYGGVVEATKPIGTVESSFAQILIRLR
uniref:Uncharacterized protein n=1 Tax=Octopus bimaculoides TaxID=37653 RepID=A0A0L8FJ86_OCTBM